MKEELLQYIWQYKYLLNQKLFTTRGEQVHVIQPGLLNRDSGPDFFNAMIRLNNTLWAGNIEVHIKSSDWKKHRHQEDAAYDNVILHVVLHHDEPVFNKFNEEIPTLELREYLPENIVKKYHLLKQTQNDIACYNVFSMPPNHIVTNWLERLSMERLENKCTHIHALLRESNNNWSQVFYRLTAKYFGQKINELPFELIAQRLPMHVIARNQSNLLQTQALVLGVAGMLGKKFNNDYLDLLAREYRALQNKYQLEPIDKSLWKFGRTRPANFPTIRLLQFAQLLHVSHQLYSRITEVHDINEVISMFTIESDQLVQTGAMYNRYERTRLKGISAGKNFATQIIINAVVPCLFAHGKWSGNETQCIRAVDWLNTMKAEENSIIRKWKILGIEAGSAKQSQALIALNNYYCKQQQCLRCAFGNYILNKPND